MNHEELDEFIREQVTALLGRYDSELGLALKFIAQAARCRSAGRESAARVAFDMLADYLKLPRPQ